MNYTEIIDLFRNSENSPEIKKLLKNLHIPLQKEKMSVVWREYKSKKWDVLLVFKAKNNFLHNYGEYKKSYTKGYGEAFLEEINFGSQSGKINYPFPLPYEWAFSDKPETVKAKIKIKPSESSNASYGGYLQFNTEEYQFVTGFNKQNKLTWVRVRPLELAFKKKRELAKSMRQQNKNIRPENAGKIEKLKNQSPVAAWKKRMNKGDTAFNEKCLGETAKILESFMDNLVAAAGQKKANAVYSSVKKVTQRINDLNDKYGCIETLEREELADYIHKAVRLTGFKMDKGVDLTEEWREW